MCALIEQGGGNNFGLSTSDNQNSQIALETTIASNTTPISIVDSLTATLYDIYAAPYSISTNISSDYIFDHLELNFTTSQTKTVTIISSKGTVIYSDTNTLTSMFVGGMDLGFKSGENLTVSVTQTSGACLMNLVLKIRQGTIQTLGTATISNYANESGGNLQALKINSDKFAIFSPSGAGANGTVTLTLASTAYQIPASTPVTAYTIIFYNGSDSDMYFGFATLTTAGILVPSGGTMTVDLGANQAMFAYCLSVGKIINYSYKLIS